MSRLERQKEQETILKRDCFKEAEKVFIASGLISALNNFYNEFPLSFPGLIYEEKVIKNKNIATGMMIELEWDQRSSRFPETSYYKAKVARIKIDPDGLIHFGKGKITGKSKVNEDQWLNDTTGIITDALLKLMNSTKLSLYEVGRRKLIGRLLK